MADPTPAELLALADELATVRELRDNAADRYDYNMARLRHLMLERAMLRLLERWPVPMDEDASCAGS